MTWLTESASTGSGGQQEVMASVVSTTFFTTVMMWDVCRRWIFVSGITGRESTGENGQVYSVSQQFSNGFVDRDFRVLRQQFRNGLKNICNVDRLNNSVYRLYDLRLCLKNVI
jgi:hypothetical protein